MIFRRRGAGQRVRLFFATDVHGSDQCFRKWLNAIKTYKVDALILGGDITGKTLIPIVPVDGGGWRADVFGVREFARDDTELSQLQARIRQMGAYDVMLTEEETQAFDQAPGLVSAAFEAAMRESLQRWTMLADERLAPDTPCFSMLGNDDIPSLAEVLQSSTVMRYAEDEVFELPGGYELMSFGFSTPTPWHTPRELPEDQFALRIEKLAQRLTNPQRAIFNIHCPPRDTHLDQAPRLDENLKPVTRAGGTQMVSVGSQAVREAIERYQPLLGLHGHVHESSAGARLGRTLCINPGSDYMIGMLRGAIVELEDGEAVRRWQITQG